MGFFGGIPRAPIIQIDPDTIRLEDLLDTDLSHYFDITIDDVNNYVLFNPKIGDLRIQDPDDATDDDYFQITADPASGGILQKSSRITNGVIWDIDHNGILDGTAATVTINEINIDLNGLTINDAATNAVKLKNIYLNSSLVTATAVGLSSWEQVVVVMPQTGEYHIETGLNITSSKGDCDNNAQPLVTMRNIDGAITADRQMTGYANYLSVAGNNESAGDFDLDLDTTAGVLYLGLGHTAITTVGAKTDPDTFQATALKIDMSGMTNNANTKLDVSARALDIVYTLTETLGELRMGASDIFRITPTIPNGITSAGAFQFDVMELNLSNIVLNDANITFDGIYIDASGLTNTASANARLISLKAPSASNIDDAIYLDLDVGDSDLSLDGIDMTRDLSAAITVDRGVSGWGIIVSQNHINTSTGDFDLTDALDSGTLKLIMSHVANTSVGAKTDPDICRGVALSIDIDGTTSEANTKLDFYPRAIDIAYNLTETLGTLRMADTDIARITATIPNALSSAGAFQFDMFELNADGVILNDVNITFNMLNLDFSGITDTLMGKAAGINITSPTGRIPAIDTNARGLISGRIEQGAYYFYDHFWGRAQLSQWTTRITTGAVGGAPTSTDLNGVLEMLTGGAIGNEESLDWNDIFTFDNTLRPTFECKIWISDADGDTNVAVGLVNTNIGNGQAGLALNQGGALNQDFVIIEYSTTTHGDALWHLSCQCDGVSTVDDGAAAAATTWTVLRFEFISDTSIEWFIDGTSQGIVATNVPTDPLQPILFVLTDANATRAIEIDSVKIWQDIA